MTNPKPAHFFLENATDLGPGWVEKLDDGGMQIRFTYAGEDKTIVLGGSVGLSKLGHTEPDTYTVIGATVGIPWDE